MKICLITSTYALSEQDTNVPFLVENVRRLVEHGAEVQVFAPSFEGQGSHRVYGVPVHRFRYFFRRWENLTHKQGAPNRIRNPLYVFVALFYILFGLVGTVRFCRKNRFDVIHVHWPFPHGIWGFAASRLSGAPMVLSFHGAELLLARKYFFVKYFLRHAIEHARAVHVNSTFTADEVAKLSKKPVAIIPFGCTVAPKAVPKDPTKSVKDVLFVGRLIARKGVEYLVRAVPLMLEKMPLHLHIVGHGDRADALKALTRRLGLEGHVTFHGVVSQEKLQGHYGRADVFVLPAIVDERGDTEGLGVVLVEALCFKTPVVASRVGGIPDVIVDGRTGILVPQKDLAVLASSVVELLQDRARAERLAEGGLKYANDYFNWQRITDRFLRMYQEAVTSVQHPARSPVSPAAKPPTNPPHFPTRRKRVARLGPA